MKIRLLAVPLNPDRMSQIKITAMRKEYCALSGRTTLDFSISDQINLNWKRSVANYVERHLKKQTDVTVIVDKVNKYSLPYKNSHDFSNALANIILHQRKSDLITVNRTK